MFGFLRSIFRRNAPPALSFLTFKSPQAAFEYACEYMRRPLVQGAELIGYVDGSAQPDPENRFMTKRLAQGKFAVTLATDSGPFHARYCGSIAANFAGREVTAGDLVEVSAAVYDPKSVEPMNYFLIEMILLPQLEVPAHRFMELLKLGLGPKLNKSVERRIGW